MKRILVLADDLTGAAEIAGVAMRYGLSADLFCGEIADGAGQVCCVDTDTRALSPAAATSRLSGILASIPHDQFAWVYKKTDSALRGNIAAEVRVITTHFKLAQTILLPQNPSRGRTISSGEYRINGVPLHETEFAHDPEHPATTSDALKLLDPRNEFNAIISDPDSRGREPRSLTLKEPGLPPPAIILAEASHTNDVLAWAKQIDANALVAGGADFFQAILESKGHARAQMPGVTLRDGKTFIVCLI